jgi:hypothetical protein
LTSSSKDRAGSMNVCNNKKKKKIDKVVTGFGYISSYSSWERSESWTRRRATSCGARVSRRPQICSL